MQPSNSNRRPNIIFLLVDDMGWMDLSCQGSRFYRTPNIDRLAQQSLRFDNAYAACPVCSPTRASILTGRYPASVGITDYIPGQYLRHAALTTPPNKWQLPLDETTVAQMLGRNGYATGHVGKWHLGHGKEASRMFGFDYVVEQAPNDNDKMTSGLTDAAIRFIEEHREEPFFLYFAHYAVHLKIEAKPELIEKYKGLVRDDDPRNNPAYAAMIEHLDDSVGKLLQRLDALNLSDDTVFVFFSDNGGLLDQNGERITSNLPLRGGKGMLYEGGIREPLFIRYPRRGTPGRTDEVVTSVDFLPTMLDLAGVQADGNKPLDGISLAPVIFDRKGLPERSIYWHYPHYHREKPSGAIRRGRHKLIEWFEDGRRQLFDLENDLGEKHDMAADHPRLVESLAADLAAWRRRAGALMPAPNPDFDPARAEEQFVPEGWAEVKARAKATGVTPQGD